MYSHNSILPQAFNANFNNFIWQRHDLHGVTTVSGFSSRSRAAPWLLTVNWLCSFSARSIEGSESAAWTWAWNTLRTKAPPTSPTITQTAPQAPAFRRSRRPNSWTSSGGQLNTRAPHPIIINIIIVGNTIRAVLSRDASCCQELLCSLLYDLGVLTGALGLRAENRILEVVWKKSILMMGHGFK